MDKIEETSEELQHDLEPKHEEEFYLDENVTLTIEEKTNQGMDGGGGRVKVNIFCFHN